MDAILPVALYLVVINAATFLTFRKDKLAAEAGQWRVPEKTLLGLALIGGTPGAFAAQRILRHKTQKQPFVSILRLIFVLQVVAIGALVGDRL